MRVAVVLTGGLGTRVADIAGLDQSKVPLERPPGWRRARGATSRPGSAADATTDIVAEAATLIAASVSPSRG